MLEAAELTRIRYHDMRHTYATNLLKAGENITDVSGLLGHSSIQITVDTYGHFLPSKERRVSLTNALGGGSEGKQSA